MSTDNTLELNLNEAAEIQTIDPRPASISEFARTLTNLDTPKDFFASLQTYLGKTNVKKIELYANDYEIPSSKLIAYWVRQDGKLTNSIVKQDVMRAEEVEVLLNGTPRILSTWDPRSGEYQHKILMPLKIQRSLLIINMNLPMEEFKIFQNTHDLLKDLITIWINGMSHKF